MRRFAFVALLAFLLVAALSIALFERAEAAVQPVLGIDLGAEFIKVGLVKYGVGVDILLNEQSKRKTPSAVAFRDSRDRYFGETAKSLETRFPENTFRYMNLLLGQRYSNVNKTSSSSTDALDAHFDRFANQWNIPVKLLRNRERGEAVDIALPTMIEPQQRFQVEELFGMLFNYLKDLAAKSASGSSSSSSSAPGSGSWDCVIAVPAFYSQSQRQGVLDAARIAGFNVLSLMHDTTSALLQYGVSKYKTLQEVMSSEKGKTHSVLLFDMGATATKVAVAQYNKPAPFKDAAQGRKASSSSSSSSSELGQLNVKSVAWDKSLGGKDFDARLTQHFVRCFEKSHGADKTAVLRQNRRALARIMQQAQKVKEVLSANADTMFIVESVIEGVDLRCKITRDEFHSLCKDLFDRALEPVRRAIQRSGISMRDIDAFELIGGSSRIPLVQQRLREMSQRELSFSLNSDESIALGAAFHGANISPFFRVKSYAVNDVSPYQIDFVLSSASTSDAAGKGKAMTLFKVGDSINTKKTINVPRTEDFTITIKYADDGSIPESYLPGGDLAQFGVRGVQDAMANFTAVLEEQKAETEPGSKTKVQVSFEINSNGFVVLDSAQATLERIVKVLVNESATAAVNATAGDAKPAPAEPKYKKHKKSSRVQLSSETHNLSVVRPMTAEQIKAVESRIAAMNAFDRKKAELSRWRNALESQLYNVRSQFLEDDDNKPYYSEQQKQVIVDLLDTLDAWSNDEGQESDKGDEAVMERLTDAFKQRVESIEALIKPIQKRIQKRGVVDRAFADCKQKLDKSRALNMLLESMEHITAEERADVSKSLQEAEDFIAEQTQKQTATPLYEELDISPEGLRYKCSAVELKVDALLRKPRPVPPKVEKPAPEATAQTEKTDASSAGDATTESKPNEQAGSEQAPAAGEEPVKDEEPQQPHPIKDEL